MQNIHEHGTSRFEPQCRNRLIMLHAYFFAYQIHVVSDAGSSTEAKNISLDNVIILNISVTVINTL